MEIWNVNVKICGCWRHLVCPGARFNKWAHQLGEERQLAVAQSASSAFLPDVIEFNSLILAGGADVRRAAWERAFGLSNYF